MLADDLAKAIEGVLGYWRFRLRCPGACLDATGRTALAHTLTCHPVATVTRAIDVYRATRWPKDLPPLLVEDVAQVLGDPVRVGSLASGSPASLLEILADARPQLVVGDVAPPVVSPEEAKVRVRKALEAFSVARGVPDELEILAVVTARYPPSTQALEAIARLLAWRADALAKAPTGRRSPGATLVLGGIPGSGKSSALGRAVAHWPGRDSARFVEADYVAAIPLNAWDHNRAVHAALAGVPLLALDELGEEEAAIGSLRIARLVRKRHNRGGVNLLAGTLTREQFEARYFKPLPALRSRLEGQAARGLDWWVQLPAIDFRLPAGRAALVALARCRPELRRTG